MMDERESLLKEEKEVLDNIRDIQSKINCYVYDDTNLGKQEKLELEKKKKIESDKLKMIYDKLYKTK